MQSELDGYKAEQTQYEKDRKSAARFLKLVDRYSNAEEMTTLMLNEFVEKIVVHERDRKGSADTTQKIEIYFNFIGEYIPPTMAKKEPTPEELEKLDLCQYFGQKKSKDYAAFFSSSSSFCCGVR